jgi:nucleoside-diphosphate-sugar epimerase
MSVSKILVTGANGFVGSALALRLQREIGISVCKAYRAAPGIVDVDDNISVGDIGPETDWSAALSGVDAVVHCAARVHVMNDDGSADSLAEFRKVNVQGTQNLAHQAAAAGIRRLVFVSSIKVNGETTTGLSPFSHTSQPLPVDAYGISKWEAEQELWKIARQTGLQVVVVRPPLVYGPGVKANFLRLMKTVNRRIPLPFGAAHNQRSMVYLENLADLLVKCVMHPRAASQTFLASDGRDLSTGELVEQLSLAMNIKPRLVSVPPALIYKIARLTGKQDFADRLLGSLQVDITHTCETLDWEPPYTVEAGMRATVQSLVGTSASV